MDNQIYVIEVNKGEEIKEVVNNFMCNKGWNSAYISGAVGSITNIQLSNPQRNVFPIEVGITELEGPCEVVSFVGEIMKKEYMKEELKSVYKDDGSNLFIHIHISCSTKNGLVYGGGFRKGNAFRGLNIYIQEMLTL